MTRKLTIDGMDFEVASEWDELSRRQLEYLASLQAEPRTAVEVMTLMLLDTLGAHVNFTTEEGDYNLTIQGRRMIIDAERMSWMADLYSFLFEEDEKGAQRLSPKLTISPYPEIQRRDVRLRCTDDGMLSMPFGRYVWLQTYLSGVQRDKDNLELALACEWHSVGETLEPKDSDAKIIRNMSPGKRMVMFWYISGCMRRIHRLFPRVFSGVGSAVGGNVLDQQLRLLDSLAGGDMTKKDQVRKGRLIDALYVIDESLRRKEEYDRELEKMNATRRK